MKKFLIASSALVLPVFASAQSLSGVQTLVSSIGTIIDKLIPIIFALAMLFFFWGLAQYILASGKEDSKEEGRRKMIWGIIALFVMSAVWGIVRWIGSSLNVNPGEGAGFSPKSLIPGGSANQ